MSAVISLADARRPPVPPGIDWATFDTFADLVALNPELRQNLRDWLLILERELRNGHEQAPRYQRLVEAEMRRPLRARQQGDEFNSKYLDKIILVASLLSHFVCWQVPADNCQQGDAQ